RMHCKVLKDESQLADYSGVKNKRDFKSNSAYDANYTCPSDTKSFFGTSEKRDFTYDFINSEDPKAYYLRVKGGRELNLTEEYESLLRMTEEEKKIYNYLHHTSKEEADRYLELLNQSLKTRLADEKFEKIKDHAVLETLSGYGAGVIQVTENIENRLGLNDDADGVPLVSENEVYSSMVQEDLANKGKEWETAYGLTYGAGQATPGIVLTAATGGGAGSLIATTGLYSISAGGAARTEALRKGYTQEAANNYANLTSAEEAAKILAMGAVTKGIGGNAGTAKFAEAGQNTSEKLLTGVKIGSANAAIEAADEALIKPQIGYNTLHDPDKLKVDGQEVIKNATIAGVVSMLAYEGEHVL
ncbi:MAG: hypothetical protein HUJ70_09950, partial [Pseudobutyrivibrio sp.]|nr:hypothetical protein [Pseudobutyrivibrio sp.]